MNRRCARIEAALAAAALCLSAMALAAPSAAQAAAETPPDGDGGLGANPAGPDGPAVITAETLTDEQVRAAIHAIVEELYRRKHPQRFWDPENWRYDRHGSEDQVGGYTALVALALLYAGESYQDPRLADAIDALEAMGLSGTYAVALRTHVWSMLPNRFKSLLASDAQWLMRGFSSHIAGWDYTLNPRTTREDNSLAQYGALGLWEAAKRDVPVDQRYWRQLEERFVNNQLEDGSWNYTPGRPGTGSMTTAGLTVLFITQDYLHAEKAVRLGAPTDPQWQRAVDLGMQWMGDHFSATENPGRDTYFFYYLYGVERVGIASGYKFFGEHDWFREGAAEIIRRLCAYDPKTGTMTVHERAYGKGNGAKVRMHHLAFGLMFLSRGRVPVAINKLRLDDTRWSNRPRDAANLTGAIVDVSESALNWQIVDVESEPLEWLEAPVLYLASDQALPWLGDDDAAVARRGKLKRYLDLGGMLLAVNEGTRPAFATSVEALGAAMYPQYEWRDLPPEHWAYTIHRPVGPRRPALRALSNGVRELIVLAPADDLAATFQVRGVGDAEHVTTAANLYFYASELNRPRPRLAAAPPGAALDMAPNRTVTVARGRYDGAWNPEPAALEVFGGFLARRHSVGLHVIDVDLADLADAQPQPAAVIVSGVEAHAFTDAEVSALKTYIERGGTILFETVGGRGRFALHAEREMIRTFRKPPRALRRTPMVTGEGVRGALNLSEVNYRPYALQLFGAAETTPRLRGISIDGEPRVLFSREDISFGLLDQPCWGVSGYTPRSARDLLANIVLHAMQPTESAEPDEDE